MIAHRHQLALRFVGERPHAARRVIRLRQRVGFEEQPALVQNPEKVFAGIESMRAEHRLRAHVRQRAQLVEHKFLERVVRHKFVVVASSLWLDLVEPQAQRYTRSIICISP